MLLQHVLGAQDATRPRVTVQLARGRCQRCQVVEVGAVSEL